MKRTSGTQAAARIPAAALMAVLAVGVLGTGTASADTGGALAGGHSAADVSAARKAATTPATMSTLSRFFSRDGTVARSAVAPRAEGITVPVLTLAPEFVAGKKGAPIARTEFLATKAVSSDGRTASVWAAKVGGDWQVVNIATGDDEFRYTRTGERKLPGGTVFREPQIDAWFVSKGTKVLPLDKNAARAVGVTGTTLTAYRDRVRTSYADKLPGSAYAKKGVAGGYGPAAEAVADELAGTEALAAGTATAAEHAVVPDDSAMVTASVAAGAGGVIAVALALRLRRRA
ncbi:hypothetical protein [Streptomyces sp. CAU 1734]|uniref:hypothetical protein n=1 Tax=Streptomyces sp. CAU 1734 TaxID=3140360 RepID=UPI0032602005